MSAQIETGEPIAAGLETGRGSRSGAGKVESRGDQTVHCSHCTLPVPAGLIQPQAEQQFCCSGCAGAYALIHGHQLDGYYAICDQIRSCPRPPSAGQDRFEDFDHPDYAAGHIRRLSETAAEVRWLVDGLHCAACVWLLEKLPRLQSGVLEVRVDLPRRTAIVTWNPQEVALSQVARRFAELGYLPMPAGTASAAVAGRMEHRRRLIQLAVAGACAGNSMLLAIALYAGWFSGMAEEHLHLLRWVSALLGMISLIGPGATFYRGAWNAVRTRTPHMDISLTLGLIAGGILGLINTITGRGEIYFDSLSMLIFVLLVGRYFQFQQQRRAAEQVAVLQSLIPRSALRIVEQGTESGQGQRVPVGSLRANDLVEVRVGDVIPADGIIETGWSELDQSLLSGESTGLPAGPGTEVPAGAINLQAPLRIRVQAVGQATRIGKISALVEDASLSQSPLVELAHRVSGVFLRIVLGLAAVTLIAWWSSGMEVAVDHTIALLIVACPCALGLATPLTLAVAMGRAARRGILVRGGDVFERLNRPGMIWLDKTGTLTTGSMQLLEWQGDESVRHAVASMQAGIVHPIARCLRQHAADDAALEPLVVEELCYQPGLGVKGSVEWHEYSAGSRRWLEQQQIVINRLLDQKCELPGYATAIYITRDGQHVATAWLGDALRPEAASAVRRLRALGWDVGILSGDRPELVQQVGEALQIDRDRIRGGVLPEEKLAIVQSSREQGPVAMVGDGVNDAAALAAADVGIAVHGGAEASLQAASVYLTQPGLTPLIELLQGSRGVMRAVVRGLVLSLCYNATAVTLAACGQITPLFAAVLMPLSSASVIALATLQRTFVRSA